MQIKVNILNVLERILVNLLSLYCNGFNDLSNNIKNFLTLSSFKKQIKAYILQKFTASKPYYINYLVIQKTYTITSSYILPILA